MQGIREIQSFPLNVLNRIPILDRGIRI